MPQIPKAAIEAAQTALERDNRDSLSADEVITLVLEAALADTILRFVEDAHIHFVRRDEKGSPDTGDEDPKIYWWSSIRSYADAWLKELGKEH